jgi:hypothetical protein
MKSLKQKKRSRALAPAGIGGEDCCKGKNTEDEAASRKQHTGKDVDQQSGRRETWYSEPAIGAIDGRNAETKEGKDELAD